MLGLSFSSFVVPLPNVASLSDFFSRMHYTRRRRPSRGWRSPFWAWSFYALYCRTLFSWFSLCIKLRRYVLIRLWMFHVMTVVMDSYCWGGAAWFMSVAWFIWEWRKHFERPKITKKIVWNGDIWWDLSFFGNNDLGFCSSFGSA